MRQLRGMKPMNHDGISLTAIFGGLCIAAVISAALEFRRDFPALFSPTTAEPKSLQLAVPPEALMASRK